jgi:cell surface protein SprA
MVVSKYVSVRNILYLVLFLFIAVSIFASTPQDDNRRRPNRQVQNGQNNSSQQGENTPPTQGGAGAGTSIKAQPKLEIEDESIPDSLLHARWKIQRTAPVVVDDIDSLVLDLHMPDNIRQQAVYNDSLNLYFIGSKMGDSYLNAPVLMTPEEYLKWSERRGRDAFFRQKNNEAYKSQGKEKFSFTDMHFDLGPAEKIFGPGGVRVKTQGTAELKLGATMKNIDNPSLPIRNRKTTNFDFDEKINISANAKVGDKMNFNFNYNTDATFNFDTQNLKLKYDGKEDEIIKLVEAGNVSFPTNNSLVKGASSLFGIRTDMQFGKLKLQTVLSQKKSTTKSVSSKGGAQTTPFEIDVADYEENRHFFLAQYFRDDYDRAMSTLPNLTTGVKINRIEVWVTNKTGTTSNTRNLVAFTDLGENAKVSNHNWSVSGEQVPGNAANDLYATLLSTVSTDQRNIDVVGSALEVLDATRSTRGGVDYEKLASARLLSSSEYTLNEALGYISLRSGLQTDQVLAVAFEYTYGGRSFQVGEFASDVTDTKHCIFVKSLKNTSNNPSQGNWDLMMKNVYYLASSVEKDRFKLDIKFQSDTAGVYLTYLPEENLKSQLLLKLLGCDRLDKNMKAHANGQFDFVQGYTVTNGRIFLPAAEPFGDYMRKKIVEMTGSQEMANKYVFDQLYDSTKTIAKQTAEKDKYILTGQYKGTNANVISLGAYNVPQGSVVVTAGGVTLQEGSDYSVDYSAGEVTILNQSIIDAGTNVNVSLESNTEYGMQRKTMYGINWEYDFSKNFILGGTLMHLSEQALTSKVTMGEEPLNNTLWGLNLSWKQESQWLTNMLDKIPFLHVTQPSQIQLTGEFAQLIAGRASGTQDNASYIDDFENTKNLISLIDPKVWVLSSVPTKIANFNDKTGVSSGYDRARLAWYTVDPLFTRRSSSLTPGHIKSDLEQLSDHRVREVYVKELYPNRDQSTYNGATSTLSVLNLAYYPQERGPYNLTTQLNSNGTLQSPATKWGGMMRKLETTDFEQANIEYVEFWLMDPFIYQRQAGTASQYAGDLYINLGEVSEDILRDGKKFYESGMPVDGSDAFSYTQWGKIPEQATQTYAFATTSGSRVLQDVGLNGLNDEEERTYGAYKEWLDQIGGIVQNDSLLQAWRNDPAGDDYHYYRGSDFDDAQTSIMDRYKRINNPQGNSPDTDNRTESYDTSYKTGPDVEDINQDYTLNEYERYYQYKVRISDDVLQAYNNGTATDSYITDRRDSWVKLRNGDSTTVRWYQFRIPLAECKEKVGSINDFTSIRFMRMYMTGFEKPIVLRFGSLDLVRGEWRQYKQSLQTAVGAETGTMVMSAVNIEENTDRQPVAYTLPPGINRATDPSQPQLVENNEQALCLTVRNLSHGESKAVYKNLSYDLRQYKRMQMFVHANHLLPNTTNLQDDQLAVFIRLGSDYKSNYYEYEIPLKLTPEGKYSWLSANDRSRVWPSENMLDVDISVFTRLKKARNKAKSEGTVSYNQVFSQYDEDRPNNKVSIVGNPSLGEVKTMVIGVRNLSSEEKSGEVWVNELRLKEYNNEGGWAASGAMNVQLSDFGSVNLTGHYVTDGFGGLEESVLQRSKETQKSYSVTANFELGKFFPDKAKVTIPVYYSVSKDEVRPKYNPLDTDMDLDDALDAAGGRERDSIESIAVTKRLSRNFSLSNMRVGIKTKRHPMPYDPANFSLSYSHRHNHTTGQTTVYENDDQWRGALSYNYSPVYKTWEPFKNAKGKSKWLNFPKALGLNYLPQTIAFNTEMTREYYELQERDLENTENPNLPVSFNSQILWNREFQLRWDLTKNLHMNFQSATRAQIEEPYRENIPINKELYPDFYSAWKDSVKQSILHLGTPLDYRQNFTASYQLPLNKLPIFDWVNSDASYTANYTWVRGTELDDGRSLGNTITNNRNLNINGAFNLETLYNHSPFLKKVNDRFKKAPAPKTKKTGTSAKSKDSAKTGDSETPAKSGKSEKASKEEASLPKNKNTFQKEITLTPDTTIAIQHNKKSKRLLVSARGQDGKQVMLKWKVKDENTILVSLPKNYRSASNLSKKGRGVDTLALDSVKQGNLTSQTQGGETSGAVKVKLSVLPKQPLDKQWWYEPAQQVSRLLMMVRSVNLSYRNQRSMTLPGYIPNVGDVFGQRTGSVLAPGLDFAFGLAGDGYLEKARENGWLLMNESVATPFTSSTVEDLQMRATLEPVRDLKIDLNASRTVNRSRSVQYMYDGSPTTQSGSFNMTTISLSSAFEPVGDANSGYQSATFDKFRELIPVFRERVQGLYNGAPKSINPVNQYSADVLVPAFLEAYTAGSGGSLDLFPALKRMLPNWTLRYSGLSKLTWFADHFKSVNINHGYKSVFAIGSYSSYSSWLEYMGDLGFVTATDGSLTPSSMYNISTVSINEAFSPLLGMDVTLNNNMTVKLEYRTTRVLNLSMTSIQLNESRSNDWVIGLGYKISDFKLNLFGAGTSRKIKKAQSRKSGNSSKSNQKGQSNNSSQSNNSAKSTVNHALNMRADFSLRSQAAITRDIASGVSSASSGNSALKLSLAADYTLSRLMTLTFYYDRQTNTPLLSSSSYPTTTRDFGLSLKFSLTR